MLAREDILCVMPGSAAYLDAFVEPLNSAMDEFEINTPERQAAFLAQVAHESTEMTHLSENLNYSDKGLLITFTKYFTPAEAHNYARQPERIANRVYANRNGNGDEDSGDGWKYRGSGLIQLTFHDNHKACAEALKKPFEGFGNYLRTPEGACRSAAWFWADFKHLNAYADAGNFQGITKKVNGGLNGETEREAFWVRAKQQLGVA